MGPDVVQRVIPIGGGLKVLDPMSGSGTTLVQGRLRGHAVFGVDRDPLAIAIASAAVKDVDIDLFNQEAKRVLTRAITIASTLSDSDASPLEADDETKDFARFWFDLRARRELRALSEALQSGTFRTIVHLRVAFSRMIVTKSKGVSLGLDVSHSRPHRHRTWIEAPISPFDAFPQHVKLISRKIVFRANPMSAPVGIVSSGDCRSLDFPHNFFDLIITSPPYLNAIDYLRGHKLALVWLGYSVNELRELRSTNVGADRGLSDSSYDQIVAQMIDIDSTISPTLTNKVRRYARDLTGLVSEIARVSKQNAKIVFVIGDCAITGTYVKNSDGIVAVATQQGLKLISREVREITGNRRYLPPPASISSGRELQKRINSEAILEFRK